MAEIRESLTGTGKGRGRDQRCTHGGLWSLALEAGALGAASSSGGK